MKDRILCLDVGARRVGIAVSDPLGFSAQPVGMIDRKKGEAEARKTLEEILARYAPKTLVVGLPLALSGREGMAVKRTRRYLESIADLLEGITVVEWDERLTTQAAQSALIEGDVSRAKRKHLVDAVAASLILQSYLGSLA